MCFFHLFAIGTCYSHRGASTGRKRRSKARDQDSGLGGIDNGAWHG